MELYDFTRFINIIKVIYKLKEHKLLLKLGLMG